MFAAYFSLALKLVRFRARLVEAKSRCIGIKWAIEFAEILG
jgi:hypothetical protein